MSPSFRGFLAPKPPPWGVTTDFSIPYCHRISNAPFGLSCSTIFSLLARLEDGAWCVSSDTASRVLEKAVLNSQRERSGYGE